MTRSSSKKKTTGGFSEGILWEMLFAFSGIIALATFIVILAIRLHAHTALNEALLAAAEDAVAGFGITAFSLVVVTFGIVYISNQLEGKR
jgi:magnesium-transporting ATPase (P-type)